MTNSTTGGAGQGGDLASTIIGAAAGAIEKVTAGAVDTSQIREHMEVIGSDGRHVGIVDHVEGDQIKLARKDPAAGGQHHFVPLGQVESVVVRLAQPADEAQRQWRTEPDAGAPGMR